jgi:hypothetical protein
MNQPGDETLEDDQPATEPPEQDTPDEVAWLSEAVEQEAERERRRMSWSPGGPLGYEPTTEDDVATRRARSRYSIAAIGSGMTALLALTLPAVFAGRGSIEHLVPPALLLGICCIPAAIGFAAAARRRGAAAWVVKLSFFSALGWIPIDIPIGLALDYRNPQETASAVVLILLLGSPLLLIAYTVLLSLLDIKPRTSTTPARRP